jgi:hypothetical protein
MIEIQQGDKWLYRCEECGGVFTYAKQKTIVPKCAHDSGVKCRYRGPVVATIAERVAGCGCSNSNVEVYHCLHFNEPVIKYGHPPCLDTLREQVPGATGRTCRECKVPMQRERADIIHVTPRADWQHVTTRGRFALRQAGMTATCYEIVKPTAEQLDQEIADRQPRIVFIHAFSVAADAVIRLAGKWPNVRFVVVSHSMENHVLTWPQFFGEMRLILDASKRLGNLQFAGSEDCQHWRELGYDVLRWHWPCVLADGYSAPPTLDPPSVLIVSRADIVKALPAQILAAAILQRCRGVRVLYSVNGETGTRSKGLDDLAAVAGLQCERLPWVGYDGFLRRLRGEVSVVLQPSMSETFNYVSWEAGSVGRPWVGSAAIRHTPPAWRADPNGASDIARVAGEILDGYQNASRESRRIAVAVAQRNNAAYADSIGQLLDGRFPG